MEKNPDHVKFQFLTRATVSCLVVILLALSASADSNADTGNKLGKPSTKQLLLEYTVDDHLKEGWEKGGIEIFKGTGKALAFAIPYTGRDILMLPITLPMSLYKNIGKTSKFLSMKNADSHILTKSGKVIIFIPAYAYKIAEGAIRKAIKDPCQTTLNLVAASLIIGKVLEENKAVAEDLGIYKHRQRDNNTAPVKQSSAPPTPPPS
ncbi:hypothetical protein KAI19_04280 [bacterium]|nr:hypothetical protein [bacterium]